MRTGNGSDPSVHHQQQMSTRSSLTDAPRVQAPEIQQMYSLNMPVSAVRTKIRQEFERHRYVSHLHTVDMLLFQSSSEFQVC